MHGCEEEASAGRPRGIRLHPDAELRRRQDPLTVDAAGIRPDISW